MLHRRTAAVLLGAVALTVSACGSSSSSADSGSDAAKASTSASAGSSAGSTAGSSAGSTAGSTGGSTSDKQYCDALNTMPDSSKYKTLGDAMDGLSDWANKLKSLGTPADMPADAAAAGKTFPDALVKAINSALGGLDRSTPISEVQKKKGLETKFDAAVAPMEKTLGDGSPFDKWATAHCD